MNKNYKSLFVCAAFICAFISKGNAVFAASQKDVNFELAQRAIEKKEYEKAYDLLEDSLDSGNMEANTLIGDLFLYGNGVYQDIDEAILCYEDSLDYYDETGDNSSKGYYETIVSYGHALELSGYYNEALDYYQQAQELAKKLFGDKALELASCYNNIGGIYFCWGDHEQALSWFGKALEICVSVNGGKNSVTADSFDNYAVLYQAEKKYDQAYDYLTKEINILEQLYGKESENAAAAYINLANFYLSKGDYNSALKTGEKSLKIYEKVYGDYHIDIANAYKTLAQIYTAKKDFENAIDNYENALIIVEVMYGDYHQDVADIYFDEGLLLYDSGLYKKAFKYLSDAFLIYEDSENYNQIIDCAWKVYSKLQKVPEKYKDDFDDLKLQALSAGINAVENSRISMSSKKTEITAKALPLYYAAVDMYAQAGEEKEAFYYSELLRSRGFLEEIGTEAALKLDGITDKERDLFKKYTEEINNLSKKVSVENSKGKETRDSSTAEKYSSQLEDTKKKLSDLEKSIGQRIPKFTQLRNPEPVTFEEAKKWCGKDRAILEYVLWDDSYADTKLNIKSYCLVITNKKVTAVELDSNFDYTAAVENLRKLIIDKKGLKDKDFAKAQSVLFNKLIVPILPALPLKPDNIMIVPDGNLSFVPFDVLCTDDGVYLGEAYNLSISPSVSVSMMSEQNSRKTDEKILAVGNAVYDKNSSDSENRGLQLKFLKALNQPSQEDLIKEYAKPETAGKYYEARHISWSNIPGTGVEIQNLKNKVFEDASFKMLQGKDATEAAVKNLSASKELSDYSVIHFACHGYFDTLNYQMSSIVFSEVSEPLNQRVQDGYMTLSEASLLNINANLVNLSACQTGLSQLNKGDGMTGLTRSFLVAGARNVGVTLWSVDDEATCEFMTRMYSKVEKYGFTYQEAYSEVKSEFRKIEKWNSPYYWAAFVLYE